MRPNGSTKRHRRGFRRWVPGSDVVPVASSCRATGMNENVAPACGKIPFRARAICRRLKLNFRPAESRCGWRVRKTREAVEKLFSRSRGATMIRIGRNNRKNELRAARSVNLCFKKFSPFEFFNSLQRFAYPHFMERRGSARRRPAMAGTSPSKWPSDRPSSGGLDRSAPGAGRDPGVRPGGQRIPPVSGYRYAQADLVLGPGSEA